MLLVAAAVGGIVIVFCGYVGYRLVSSTYYRLVTRPGQCLAVAAQRRVQCCQWRGDRGRGNTGQWSHR